MSKSVIEFYKEYPPVVKDPCSYSDELQTLIHRFDLGQCVCRCGSFTVTQKPLESGLSWKDQNALRFKEAIERRKKKP